MTRHKIDFNDEMTAEALDSERTRNRSQWADILATLREGVQRGEGKFDTFYRVGTFTTASGARTAIRGLMAQPARVPGAFDLQPRVCTDAKTGRKYSELWAAVPAKISDETSLQS